MSTVAVANRQRRQRCSANCGNLVHMGRILCEACAAPTGKPWEPRTVWGKMRKAAREKVIERTSGYARIDDPESVKMPAQEETLTPEAPHRRFRIVEWLRKLLVRS